MRHPVIKVLLLSASAVCLLSVQPVLQRDHATSILTFSAGAAQASEHDSHGGHDHGGRGSGSDHDRSGTSHDASGDDDGDDHGGLSASDDDGVGQSADDAGDAMETELEHGMLVTKPHRKS